MEFNSTSPKSVLEEMAPEYLNQLQQRTKWNKPRRNLKVNDMVLLKEDNLPTSAMEPRQSCSSISRRRWCCSSRGCQDPTRTIQTSYYEVLPTAN
ncbi:hypothetical protein TNCV_5098201 [Trichonephila clavipes]|uniref:DUF5641 domain-containing protein n=1 Tax=Trichonephila clavipes TaxID=2585209 RepID=A0A8X6VC12_TRICX|nr:hypothetical protein TNCV_5098201 [Trichonephila clavipes]